MISMAMDPWPVATAGHQMDVQSITMLICQLISICTCLIKYITCKNNLCPRSPWCGLPRSGSCCRHDYGCLNASQFCCICNTLCMVSSRSGDQPFCLLFFCQRADLVVSTSYFISTGILHVFRLEIYFISGLCRKIFAIDQFCFQGDLFNDFPEASSNFF